MGLYEFIKQNPGARVTFSGGDKLPTFIISDVEFANYVRGLSGKPPAETDSSPTSDLTPPDPTVLPGRRSRDHS